jgi:hypothetical protein
MSKVPLDLHIKSISFSGAPELEVDAGGEGVVLIIGPNNSGKSRALREIEEWFKTEAPTPHSAVIKSMTIGRAGSSDDMLAWIRATTPLARDPGLANSEHRVARDGRFINAEHASHLWTEGLPLGDVSQLFVYRADADSRLGLASSVDSIDIIEGTPILPLQRLLVDHEAEQALSRSTERAFRTPIHVNRAGGAKLHLHLGKPIATPRHDNPDYAAELQAMPVIAQQGDGVRAFVGLMLAVLAAPYPVVLIDEPEAFLHPPQARELGRQLARAKGRQRVIATHSTEVLLGVLDADVEVNVIRLRRDGASNIPSVLSADTLRQSWSDPSLRYSRLLDGLFHEGMVISEADGDALLYQAVFDALHEDSPDGEPRRPPDVFFTQCSGKHNLANALACLRPMGVPVAAVVDLDILRDEAKLKTIVELLDGDWSKHAKDWNILRAAMKTDPPAAPLVGEVLKQIQEAVGADDTARLSEQASRRVRTITRSSDSWKRARERGGLAGLPSGDATNAATRLVESLASLGLFVVPVGALEGWARGIGDHGSSFASKALAEGVHHTNDELRTFVGKITAFVASG